MININLIRLRQDQPAAPRSVPEGQGPHPGPDEAARRHPGPQIPRGA